MSKYQTSNNLKSLRISKKLSVKILKKTVVIALILSLGATVLETRFYVQNYPTFSSDFYMMCDMT